MYIYTQWSVQIRIGLGKLLAVAAYMQLQAASNVRRTLTLSKDNNFITVEESALFTKFDRRTAINRSVLAGSILTEALESLLFVPSRPSTLLPIFIRLLMNSKKISER